MPGNASRPGILFLANSLAAGGAERHVVTLLNHLDSSRFRMHLAYLKRPGTLLPQLDVTRLDTVSCCQVSAKLDLPAVIRLRRLVRAHDVDLIVSTNTYATLYGALVRAATPSSLKLSAVFHTTQLLTPKQRLAMQLYRRVFARCDRLLYVCENQRDVWRARGFGARSDAVVHNGIDVGYFRDVLPVEAKVALRTRLGFAGDDLVVGLCAGLRPEKAHSDLLRAVAALRERGVRAKALLIGDGPQRAAIERAAASLGLTRHVHITGFQADVRPFMAASDVMTLVSRSETFSLAALESMACAKPLVMTDVGGAREQIVHGVHGLLYEPGDVAALAGHLARLVDRQTREAMGTAAAERVRRRFTLERMVSGFERHFDELLGSDAAAMLPSRARDIGPGG